MVCLTAAFYLAVLKSFWLISKVRLHLFRDFNFLGQNKLSFTMDITSLCTAIPNDEGLRALKHFFLINALSRNKEVSF